MKRLLYFLASRVTKSKLLSFIEKYPSLFLWVIYLLIVYRFLLFMYESVSIRGVVR